jgi:hypothetical protein
VLVVGVFLVRASGLCGHYVVVGVNDLDGGLDYQFLLIYIISIMNNTQTWLNWYKNDGYLQINPYLRYGKISYNRTATQMNNFKSALNSAMKTKNDYGITEDVILYRGHISIDDLFKYGNGKFIEKSYSSTSLIPLVQFGYKQLRFRLPDNIKFYIYPNNSGNSGEFEYLLESNLVYKLKGITKRRIGDLISKDRALILKNSTSWKSYDVNEDTIIDIYDCDIEPYIPGTIEPYIPLASNYKSLKSKIYNTKIKKTHKIQQLLFNIDKDIKLYSDELIKYKELLANAEAIKLNSTIESLNPSLTPDQNIQLATDNINYCIKILEQLEQYKQSTIESLHASSLTKKQYYNRMIAMNKGGGPLPLRYFDPNAYQSSASAGSDVLGVSGLEVRPKIGGKRTKRTKRTKRATRKASKRSRRTIKGGFTRFAAKGGFIPSIMESFVAGASNYIAPLAGVSAWKLLNNPNRK